MDSFAALEHIESPNGNVRLHAVTAGPKDGPAVFLLHGFPEFWYGWRHQIPFLVNAGFRVVVPDGRGYNKSSKPRKAKEDTLPLLVQDVLAIADGLGLRQFCLAGHDWGAAVAWSLAEYHPERVHKLAILNVPHPSVMPQFLLRNPRQMLRSWYMLFFQMPWLPERMFAANHFRIGTQALVRSSRPGTFSEQDLQDYRQAWSEPGSVKGMINWYRALRYAPMQRQTPRINVPTLILWGKQDRFLLPSLAEKSLSLCTQGKLKWFPQATHWLQHEEPVSVSECLGKWFGDQSSGV